VAIQAREFKIPCVGGIHKSQLLSEGLEIGIDGNLGIVYLGDIEKISSNNLKSYKFPNYYNPEIIKEYKVDNFKFLYSVIDNEAMIYLPVVDNLEYRNRSSEILKNVFKISPHNIYFEEHKKFDSMKSPSYIYSYYEDYLSVINNPELKQILEKAVNYLDNLDLENFKIITNQTREKSNRIFIEGYNLLNEFKKNKDTSILEDSAKLLDSSLQFAILYNNVIIVSVAPFYLEKNLKKEGSITLAELLSKEKFESMRLQQIKDISLYIEYLKNTELEPLTYNGETFIDLIDYIYNSGFGQYVEKYQW